MKTYHVGLLAKNRTAVFQFRRSIDFLDCEILKYLGKRLTTKKAAKERLQEVKHGILNNLNKEYPNKNFTNIIVD